MDVTVVEALVVVASLVLELEDLVVDEEEITGVVVEPELEPIVRPPE